MLEMEDFYAVAYKDLWTGLLKSTTSDKLIEINITLKKKRKTKKNPCGEHLVREYRRFTPTSPEDFQALKVYGRLSENTDLGKVFVHKCFIVAMAVTFEELKTMDRENRLVNPSYVPDGQEIEPLSLYARDMEMDSIAQTKKAKSDSAVQKAVNVEETVLRMYEASKRKALSNAAKKGANVNQIIHNKFYNSSGCMEVEENPLAVPSTSREKETDLQDHNSCEVPSTSRETYTDLQDRNSCEDPSPSREEEETDLQDHNSCEVPSTSREEETDLQDHNSCEVPSTSRETDTDLQDRNSCEVPSPSRENDTDLQDHNSCEEENVVINRGEDSLAEDNLVAKCGNCVLLAQKNQELESKIALYRDSENGKFFTNIENIVQQGYQDIKNLFKKGKELEHSKISLCDAAALNNEEERIAPEGKIFFGDILVEKKKIEAILQRKGTCTLQFKIDEIMRLGFGLKKLQVMKYYLQPSKSEPDRNVLDEMYARSLMNIINDYNTNVAKEGEEVISLSLEEIKSKLKRVLYIYRSNKLQ